MTPVKDGRADCVPLQGRVVVEKRDTTPRMRRQVQIYSQGASRVSGWGITERKPQGKGNSAKSMAWASVIGQQG